MDKVNLVCTCIYTLEAVIKIIAMGFITQRSYLRDIWNLLDLIVVLQCLICPSWAMPSGLRPLRLFRYLRVLRSCNVIPHIRALTGMIILTIMSLLRALPFFVILFSMMAILGLRSFVVVDRGFCIYS